MSTVSSEPPVVTAESRQFPRVPWNPWWGLAFIVLVYYAAQFIAGGLLLAYAWLNHWPSAYTADQLNNSVGLQFAYILIAEVLSVAAVWRFLKAYKFSLADIGFKRPRWSDPFYGVSAVPFYFVSYLVAVAVISHFVPSLNINEQQQLGFNNVSGTVQMALTFISLVVLPPLAEEIMVRGFLYSSLKKAMPTAGAVIVTSAIFASAHLPEGGSAGPLYIAAIDTFILSLVLIYLRERTGSLWAGITLHAIKNGIAFVALFGLHIK
jgi:hypothetical protein